MNELILQKPGELALELEGYALPAIVVSTGSKGAERFINFFTGQIRNANTRKAYLRVWVRFDEYCRSLGVESVSQVRPLHVASYIEDIGKSLAPSTVKQHRAAISKFFDFLVVGQIVEDNPAAVVAGPKIRISKGKTPTLSDDEYLDLMESIPTDSLIGLRDRAYISFLVYVWARVSATVNLKVKDLSYSNSKGKVRWSVDLSEKGGKENSAILPRAAHEELIPYLEAAGIQEEREGPIFRSFDRKRQLTTRALDRREALAMLKRRAKKAGLDWRKVCNHSFRATGITNYMSNGGRIDVAQERANHADSRTTAMYDHSQDKVTLEELERIRFEREHTKK